MRFLNNKTLVCCIFLTIITALHAQTSDLLGYADELMKASMAKLEAAGLAHDAASAQPIVIEAEATTKSNGVTTESDSRCSGGKRIGYLGNGKTLTFTYNAEKEAFFEITTYYMTASDRKLEFTVNGSDRYAINCPSTGSWDGASISNISMDIKLKAGHNTIVVGNASGDAPNLDKFEITYVGQPEPKPEPEPEPEQPIIAKTEAASPNGTLAVLLECNAAGVVTYAVTRDGSPLISRSRLGFDGRTHFTGGIGEKSVTAVEDPYYQPHGKTSRSDNRYTLLQAELLGSTDADRLIVEFRLYDDGVAFRYVMDSGNLTTFSGELTEFNFTDFKQALSLEYQNSYEWYYNQRPWSEMTNSRGYNEPMLVQRSADNTYILITEAANYGETGASSIVRGDVEGQLRLMGITQSTTNPKNAIKYPFTSAWRTLIIGTTKNIVESNMVNNLNPPSVIDDPSWIQPGRVAWNWAGEDRRNTDDINVAKRYADLAAYLGWEYVLIDEGWEGRFTLEEFVPYAQSRGVEVIVWYHNNKFSTSYSSCTSKMKQLARAGVKGVKIDFFEDDAQNVIQKYETLLRAAAAANIMVDFHGCTRPTGWERKYPNLMTMEAVLGGEFLLDQPHMNQADHAANLVVGRNVIGGMDFTPTKLAQRTGSMKTHSNTSENPFTTWSYQLALWTLFESGFQCLIDCPDNVIDSPMEPVLRQVPTAWDETRCIESEPTKYATLARRSGKDWYVATISKQQRTARIKLDFLEPGKEYTAYIYRDGNCSFDIAFQKRTVTSSNNLSISVKPNGGATIIITTDDNRPYLRTKSYEAESATGGSTQSSVHCSGESYKGGIGSTTQLKFRNVKVDADGEYALTLYYMLPEDKRHAYVQIEDTGDKAYYDFHTRDDYDRSKGLVMGMKTVYVQLKAGTNQISYGNENGAAPDLDKITVTPTRATQEVIDGISLPDTATTVEQTLRLDGDCIVCSTLDSATLTIYDLDGRTIQTANITAGETRVKVNTRGPIIASLSVNARAFARKFIINH